MSVTEIEHELPCGHTLPTSALLDQIYRFATHNMRGTVDCPVCDCGCHVELARMNVSTGTEEYPETFIATGSLMDGPGAYFESHQRRRVRGLTAIGRLVTFAGREWTLPPGRLDADSDD